MLLSKFCAEVDGRKVAKGKIEFQLTLKQIDIIKTSSLGTPVTQ